jgi:GrpB-like predicted nucleotidyltransferase (UPF0157 family)
MMPARAPITVVEYKPAWPAAFEAERDAIERALGALGDGVAGIEHVGSTSIPGCAAKPVIDILIGVRPLAHGELCVEPITGLGYEYMGEYGIPGRFYFRKGAPRSHHIHMVEHESAFWRDHLAFRDLLRARPDLVEQYSALKRELAAQYGPDREAYTEAKTPFVRRALRDRRTEA